MNNDTKRTKQREILQPDTTIQVWTETHTKTQKQTHDKYKRQRADQHTHIQGTEQYTETKKRTKNTRQKRYITHHKTYNSTTQHEAGNINNTRWTNNKHKHVTQGRQRRTAHKRDSATRQITMK